MRDPAADGTAQVTGTGQYQHVSAEQAQAADARMDGEVEYAIKAGRHYFVVVAAYRVSDPSVLSDPHANLSLDTENLMTVAAACYICEHPYSPRIVHNACKGPPR